MALSFAARERIVWPTRLALLLVMGVLSAAAGTKADAMPDDQGAAPPLTQHRLAASGELSVWTEGGRIFLAELGGAARALELGETGEARRLQQLLDQAGATNAASGMRLDRMILAGGGGNGFAWAPQRPARSGTATTAPAGAGSQGPADETGVPRHANPSRRPKPVPASTDKKID